MKKVTLIGFYSYAHTSDIAESRIKESVGLLNKEGIAVSFAGCFPDHDDGLIQQARRKVKETIEDSCCIVIVFSGWSESTGILNIIADHMHLPILIWSLAGYKDRGCLIAPAAAAGASLLRYSLDSMKVKYCCIYDSVDADSDLNVKKVAELIHVFSCLKQFRHTKIASIGYACSNLYPFMYDGNLIKTSSGIHVDNIELLELKMCADSVSEEDIKIFKQDFNEKYNAEFKISEKEIDLLARYYIAANAIIEKNNYRGITIKCGSGPGDLLGFTPCMLLSLLGDKLNAICECDVYGLLAQTIVNMITGLKPTFLEIFEFYKDSALMASCGFAPMSLCKKDCIRIYEHEWGGCGGLMNISQLKTGEITLFNIFNVEGKLNMQVFTGKSAIPEDFQEEGWDQHKGPVLPALKIELDAGIEYFKKNIKGPHYLIVYGNHEDIIKKYCYFSKISVNT